MDRGNFPIVKRKDEAKYNTFYANIPFAKECCEKYKNPETGETATGQNTRQEKLPGKIGTGHAPKQVLSNAGVSTKYATKAVILEVYDRMKNVMETGIPYQTILNLPPADPSIAHQDNRDKRQEI
ncbi:MAG: hypothetical protein K8T10_13785 [Candidatus Eremiobacteraeota bacterium]|nr:hypothetical protein [Candidatus Eremiobacteraeota bacterium]